MSYAPSIALPPIPQPPHDPTWILLSASNGWRQSAWALDDSPLTVANQALEVPLIPSSMRRLTESTLSLGGLIPPPKLAITGQQEIFLLSPETQSLSIFDDCSCRFKPIPCLSKNDFISEHSHLVADESRLYLSHPEAGHVAVIHRSNYQTVHKLLAPSSFKRWVMTSDLFAWLTESHASRDFLLLIRPLTGKVHTSEAEFRQAIEDATDQSPEALAWMPSLIRRAKTRWTPGALALRCHRRGILVVDRLHQGIHYFDCEGTWQRFAATKKTVSQLAFDIRGRLWILSTQGSQVSVDIYDHRLNLIEASPSYQSAIPVFPQLPIRLHADGRFFVPSCNAVFSAQGQPLSHPTPPVKRYEKEAVFLSQALDSDRYRCQWHRVLLEGTIPNHASVEVSTFTAETDTQHPSQIQSLPDDAWQHAYTFVGGQFSGDANDCLVRSEEGRYLWLKLRLRTHGTSTPSLTSIRIQFPRISLRRYLPKVFGQDSLAADFTDRFSSLFDTSMRSIEEKIDSQAKLLDPLATPNRPGQDFLTWLESWWSIAQRRHWPERKRRAFLKHAGQLFAWRGTRQGLYEQVLLYLGMRGAVAEFCRYTPCDPCKPLTPCEQARVDSEPWSPPPLILEHFKLRRWLFVGGSSLGNASRLWGERIVNRTRLDRHGQADQTQLKMTQDPLRDPFHIYAHRYTVFVPGCWESSKKHQKELQILLETESPAHTSFQIEYVYPRMRIGRQATLGYDAVIGRYPEKSAISETDLGEASVLATSRWNPDSRIKDTRIGSTAFLQ